MGTRAVVSPSLLFASSLILNGCDPNAVTLRTIDQYYGRVVDISKFTYGQTTQEDVDDAIGFPCRSYATDPLTEVWEVPVVACFNEQTRTYENCRTECKNEKRKYKFIFSFTQSPFVPILTFIEIPPPIDEKPPSSKEP